MTVTPATPTTPTVGLVVVLVTDLVGSTATMQRIGEAENDRLRRIHFALERAAVTQHGGTEVKSQGDGMMAVFTSSTGALAAGIEIQRAAHRHNRRADPARLDIRVGIHAGEALQDDDDWFGEPVVVASRLCAAAQGGEVVVSDVVRVLLSRRTGIELVPRGDLELKGIEGPVTAWSARWPDGDESPVMPAGLAADAQRACVGRETEIDVLATRWKQAAAGERQIVLIAGEPGVGKTRLATELAQRVNDNGGLVLYGRCDEETQIAYQPFVEAMRRLVTESSPQVVDDVTARHGRVLGPLLPELRAEAGDPDEVVADPDAERHQLFEAAMALIVGAARDTPTLLVLDDLHWAARPTLLLLRHIARSVHAAPLMVLGTYRDTDLDRAHPLADILADLRRVTAVERLALRGLDHEGVRAFLSSAAGATSDEAGAGLARAIHAETEGNPFFVGEVLRHLTETGALRERDGQWVSDVALADLGIPEGIREVIGRRLSRLSERTNELLSAAALIGRDFDLALVERLLGFSDDDALDSVDEAVARGVLVEVEGEAGRYAFSHALVQDTLVAELSSARRVRLHRRIATAIEELHARNLSPWFAALARHHVEAARAGGVENAVHYAVKAGQQAIGALAFEDAMALTARARQVLELDDDVDPTLELEVLLVAIEARRRLGPAPLAQFSELVAVARRVGTPAALARAAEFSRYYGSFADDPILLEAPRQALAALPKEDSVLRARVMSALAYQMSLYGLPGALEQTNEAFELAVRVRDGVALTSVATIAAFDGSQHDAAQQERVADTLFSMGDELGPGAVITGYYLRCFSCLLRADRDGFDDAATRLGELADKHRYVVGQFWAAERRATSALLDGRFDEIPGIVQYASSLVPDPPASVTIAAVAPAILAGLEQGNFAGLVDLLKAGVRNNPTITAVEAALAFVKADAGDLGGAAEIVRRIVHDGAPRRRTGDIPWAGALALLASAIGHLDEPEVAAAIEAELLDYEGLVISIAYIACLGPCDRFLGITSLVQGRFDEAERRLNAALVMELDKLRSPVLAARTRYWLAAVALKRGDRERGLALASQARSEAEAIGSFGVVKLVDRLVASL